MLHHPTLEVIGSLRHTDSATGSTGCKPSRFGSCRTPRQKRIIAPERKADPSPHPQKARLRFGMTSSNLTRTTSQVLGVIARCHPEPGRPTLANGGEGSAVSTCRPGFIKSTACRRSNAASNVGPPATFEGESMASLFYGPARPRGRGFRTPSSVVQNHAQQGVVHLEPAFVADES
jgi:hypothetical protein